MTIPKKGSRKIHVDGNNYRWLIRRKPAYAQSELHIAIEASEKPGATLVVQSNKPHPQNWDTKAVTPVTPSDIAAAIEAGWEPSTPGPSFVISETGNPRL
jgi:hypothetical protein